MRGHVPNTKETIAQITNIKVIAPQTNRLVITHDLEDRNISSPTLEKSKQNRELKGSTLYKRNILE